VGERALAFDVRWSGPGFLLRAGAFTSSRLVTQYATFKLLTFHHLAGYHHGMNQPLIIEEWPEDPEFDRVFELAGRNLRWFNDHAMELDVFKRYRGRFIAVSEGELFVGDSREEVERLAREKHPDDVPHIRYIPREKAYRIYAYQR
jgi:hypothetical protein